MPPATGLSDPPVEVSEPQGPPRAACTFLMRFTTIDELVVALAEDVSEQGVFVHTDRMLSLGATVGLRIELPTGAPGFHVLARVIRRVTAEEAAKSGGLTGLGLEFLDLDDKPLKQRLSAYVAEVGEPSAAAAAGAAGATVLVVDDQASYRDGIARALQEAGLSVETAEDGVKGMGAALRRTPDLLITDVEMPNLNGWQLVRMLRARPALAHVPVIMLTSLASEEERMRGFAAGVDDYITKPVSDDELRLRVDRMLGRSRRSAGPQATSSMLRGDLAHVSLNSLLSFLEMERRSGALQVVSPAEAATLYLRDGAVVRVDLPPTRAHLEGAQRVFHVLDWSRGRFELLDIDIDEEDTIGAPTSFLLLEHARVRDEAGEG